MLKTRGQYQNDKNYFENALSLPAARHHVEILSETAVDAGHSKLILAAIHSHLVDVAELGIR